MLCAENCNLNWWRVKDRESINSVVNPLTFNVFTAFMKMVVSQVVLIVKRKIINPIRNIVHDNSPIEPFFLKIVAFRG